MKKSPNLSINHTTYQGITQPHGIRVRTRIPDEGAWDWLESFFWDSDPALLSTWCVRASVSIEYAWKAVLVHPGLILRSRREMRPCERVWRALLAPPPSFIHTLRFVICTTDSRLIGKFPSCQLTQWIIKEPNCGKWWWWMFGYTRRRASSALVSEDVALAERILRARAHLWCLGSQTARGEMAKTVVGSCYLILFTYSRLMIRSRFASILLRKVHVPPWWNLVNICDVISC